MSLEIKVARAYEKRVEGQALVMQEGFSPRYDLDRTTGIILASGTRWKGSRYITESWSF